MIFAFWAEKVIQKGNQALEFFENLNFKGNIPNEQQCF